MARQLEPVRFYELEASEHVIVEDGGQMKVGRLVEIGNGPSNLFCSVEVGGQVKQYYFAKMYKAQDE